MKFQKVNIEITNICNLQCSFCPAVIRSKGIMEVDLFREIIKQVAPMTEQVCLHLMGDPLVHPKISDLIEICSEYRVPVFLVTNGVLMREKHLDLLLHPILRQVNFSLHSFSNNFPEKSSSEYLDKIFSYTKLAFEKRQDLYINYRLWNLAEPKGVEAQNQKMLEDIENFFNVKISREINVRSRKSIHIKNRLYLHFDTEFIWPSLDLPILGTAGTCYGLSSHFGILVDGTVVPCCLDKEGGISLGKIQEQAVTEILSSTRAQAILKGFRERKLIENLCQRCQYIERFQ